MFCVQLYRKWAHWGHYNLYFEALKGLLFKSAAIFSLHFAENVTLLPLNIIKLIPLGASTSKYKKVRFLHGIIWGWIKHTHPQTRHLKTLVWMWSSSDANNVHTWSHSHLLCCTRKDIRLNKKISTSQSLWQIGRPDSKCGPPPSRSVKFSHNLCPVWNMELDFWMNKIHH